MSTAVGPAWTDGASGRYPGRFPLAVERHAMAAVAHLLPGITTVTSHARYYSLHPLVFAEAARRGLDGDATRQLLRRAEVVMASVSLAHEKVGHHAGFRGPHGAERLSSKVTAGTVDLDAMAADPGYAQSGWGFWGPYVGPEYTLGLLETGPKKSTLPGPSADIPALTAAFDGLFDLTQRSMLTPGDLASAHHLCICQAAESADGLLLRTLLMPASSEATYSADRRSQTLQLLLRLTELLGGVTSVERDLKHALVYGPHRDEPAVTTHDARDAWTGVVLRNDLVASWRNLWAHLVDSIEGFVAVDALGQAFADDLPDGTLDQFQATLPRGIDAAGRPVDAAAALATQTLSKPADLLARIIISASRHGHVGPRVSAYFQSDTDEAYQQLTPEWTTEHLHAWADRPVRDFAVWLTHQLVARAERVALAKSRFDRRSGRFSIPTRVFVRDGFIFRDSREGGGGVALRWESAFQIMAGSGLVVRDDGAWRVTDLGRTA